MKVTEEPKDTFFVTKDTTSFRIWVILSDQEAIFRTQLDKKEQPFYEGHFTLEKFISISKDFQSFKSVADVTEGLKKQIQEGFFKFKLEDGKSFKLFFLTFGKEVALDLPLSKANDTKTPDGLQKLQETIQEYKNQVKKLKEENQQIKKLNDILNAENARMNNERSNISEYLKTLINSNILAQFPQPRTLEIKREQSFDISPKKPKKFDIAKLNFLRSINAHSNLVSDLCILKDQNRFASGSMDTTIKIFSLHTFDCKLTLKGHTDRVYCLSVMDNGNLISTSKDKKIIIWRVLEDQYLILHTLSGHDDRVIKCFEISGDRLASSSGDAIIKIWDKKNNYSCLKTLTGHTMVVISMIETKSKNFLISGSNDHTVRFWSTSNFECQSVIKASNYYWNSMIEINDKVVVGGQKEISIISINQMKVEHRITFDGLLYATCFVEITETQILCGYNTSNSSKIAAIEVDSWNILGVKDYSDVCDYIFAIVKLDDSKIISCSSEDKNNKIKIWDFSGAAKV